MALKQRILILSGELQIDSQNLLTVNSRTTTPRA
jgi:hypothetical protein